MSSGSVHYVQPNRQTQETWGAEERSIPLFLSKTQAAEGSIMLKAVLYEELLEKEVLILNKCLLRFRDTQGEGDRG